MRFGLKKIAITNKKGYNGNSVILAILDRMVYKKRLKNSIALKIKLLFQSTQLEFLTETKVIYHNIFKKNCILFSKILIINLLNEIIVAF